MENTNSTKSIPWQKVLNITLGLIIIGMLGFLVYPSINDQPQDQFVSNGVETEMNDEEETQEMNENEEESTEEEENDIEKTGSFKTVNGLYTYDIIDKGNDRKIVFYQPSLDIESKDKIVKEYTLEGLYFAQLDSGEKDSMLVFTRGSENVINGVYKISKDFGEPELLLSYDGDQTQAPRSFRLIDNGQSLAYVTSDFEIANATNSHLHIKSLVSDKTEKYFLSEESPLYSGFSFITSTDSAIYLHETGGDAGSIWTTWYKVDRNSGAVSELSELPIRGPYTDVYGDPQNPAPYVLSPNGEQVVFWAMSSFPAQEDLDSPSFKTVCLNYEARDKYKNEGGILMLSSIDEGNAKEIYRNLDYDRNTCRNIARRIIDAHWVDNNRIVFVTIEGINMIDIRTNNIERIYTFERTLYPGEQQRPTIAGINLPWISFDDGDLLNVNTQKKVNITPPGSRAVPFFF